MDSSISNAFAVFMDQAPQQASAWMKAVGQMDAVSALDKKTAELGYLAVLAAAGLTSGIPFHVSHARQLGASRQEIISAILLGLPAVGLVVIQSLPAALEAYDSPA